MLAVFSEPESEGDRMRRVLGLVLGLAALAALLAVSVDQALASHVQCGDVITRDATLDADLNCPNYGLAISASNVTLDLNGHAILGAGPGSGIYVIGAGFGQELT